MMVAGWWWFGVALAGDPTLGWMPGASPDEPGTVDVSAGAGALISATNGFSVTTGLIGRARYSPIRRFRASLFGGVGFTPVGWPIFLP